MKNNQSHQKESAWLRFKEVIDQTDIRVLVWAPPTFAMGGILAWALIGTQLGLYVSCGVSYTGIGIASLISSCSGIAEIYRREMPGPVGGIVKGKSAVVSGIVMILFFGSSGLFLLLRGLSILLGGA